MLTSDFSIDFHFDFHTGPEDLLCAWQHQCRDEEAEEELLMQYILNGDSCDIQQTPAKKK
jgi:hypothetical protein